MNVRLLKVIFYILHSNRPKTIVSLYAVWNFLDNIDVEDFDSQHNVHQMLDEKTGDWQIFEKYSWKKYSKLYNSTMLFCSYSLRNRWLIIEESWARILKKRNVYYKSGIL